MLSTTKAKAATDVQLC